MSAKPRNGSAPSESARPGNPSTAEQRAVSTTAGGVGSPYDSPTGQFPKVAMTKEIPAMASVAPGDKPSDTPGPGGPAGTDDDRTYSYASIPPAGTQPNGGLRRRNGDGRRGTLDLGLFILRLVVGGTFLYHGLQKLAGWFDGPGLDGTKESMEQGGWDHPSIAAALVTAGEVGGGILLILGLATPLAAGAVLAVILDAWMFKQGMHPDFQYHQGPGAVEMETILAGAAIAIIFTGPGRWALDRGRSWATRPGAGSLVVLILAFAAAIFTYWYLQDGNPLTGIGPFE
ncbi:DoxX family protein [Nocardia carnea]|uniref:DoxX family protein n=1 Tax=Nocardia carnea TaxID=37328 RepID=UPI0024548416|nr:DoxX family protein [Nocardia carnea]